MNIFSAIIDSIVGFVSRNPLTTIIIVMLLVFAPSVFGVLFIGVIVLLLLTLAIPAFLLFRLRAIDEIELGSPIDIVEFSLKAAWNSLGEIIGDTYTDELIDELFSRFCLGK